MKPFVRSVILLTLFIFSVVLLPSFLTVKAPAYKFGYRQAGLSEKQAAAHLLNRFTYGPREGSVDEVIKMGLENWFEQQLQAQKPDALLTGKLSEYTALKLSNQDIVLQYPQAGRVRRMAEKEGLSLRDTSSNDRNAYRKKIQAYMKEKGLKPQQELFRQFINQKILRAAYTENQLQEVLTDFWFNHFNVSLNKNQCAEFIPVYERDVIRPNALGKFDGLLLSTAKSPAMLMYLDNFSSMASNQGVPQPVNQPARRRMDVISGRDMMDTSKTGQLLKNAQNVRASRGLNENYAREVMELHTLGVDGGYTQNDVTQAARVLTGWTVNPGLRAVGGQMQQANRKNGKAVLEGRGFIQEGDFLFAANRHDTKEKVVLGRKFPAGRGYEEGVELLTMLANHPSTAKFISRKLAVRFVSDNPPQALVDKMAKVFTQSRGDVREVLRAMVTAPEFWSKEALREKTKSPFELAISAVRALNAEIVMPYQLYTWITKMGQKVYYYQAPTGFPDNGQYWINTGSLLNRMNFGLALASQKIPGVRFNLAALNNNREPESAEAALEAYAKLIMPERDLAATLKRLSPMLNDPNLSVKIEKAATKATPEMEKNLMINEDAQITEAEGSEKSSMERKSLKTNNTQAKPGGIGNNSMLAQVVGVIIGSPEFQRK